MKPSVILQCELASHNVVSCFFIFLATWSLLQPFIFIHGTCICKKKVITVNVNEQVSKTGIASQ